MATPARRFGCTTSDEFWGLDNVLRICGAVRADARLSYPSKSPMKAVVQARPVLARTPGKSCGQRHRALRPRFRRPQLFHQAGQGTCR